MRVNVEVEVPVAEETKLEDPVAGPVEEEPVAEPVDETPVEERSVAEPVEEAKVSVLVRGMTLV